MKMKAELHVFDVLNNAGVATSKKEVYQIAVDVENLNKMQKPRKWPPLHRKMTIEDFEASIAVQKERLFNSIAGRKMFISGEKHYCKKSLDELKPITLREMEVPRVHQGRYLLCRSVTRPTTFAGVTCVIEDTNGDVEHLSLFNFLANLSEDPNKSFPKGVTMIVKEPYMKLYSLQGNRSLRCDSPSDVIFVDETDELLKKLAPKWAVRETCGFDSLKKRANDLYAAKDYEQSIRYYNRANKVEPDNAVIFVNRAAAYLQLNRFNEAYSEAKRAYESQSDSINSIKVLFRMGKAAYGMRNWKLAMEHFTTLLNLHPNNAFAPEEIQRCEARIRESSMGKYDLKFMYSECHEKGAHLMDVADYVGPIEVAEVEGKGKGLVAAADIKKGTLLFASKAFSYTENDENLSLFSANLIAEKIDFQARAANLMKTVSELRNNPRRADELYSLFAGDFDRNESIPYGFIDIGRIEKICSFNTISLSVKEDNYKSSAGLWILPSVMNHSCLPNSFTEVFGDVMMVYALKDLEKAEEITTSYVHTLEAFPIRRKKMKELKFVCKCKLCELDDADSFYNKREKFCQDVLHELKGYTIPNWAFVRNTAALVDKVRRSYKNRSEMKFQLVFPLMFMSNVYDDIGETRKFKDCCREMIEILGDFQCATSPYWISLLSRALMEGFKSKEAKKYFKRSVKDVKSSFGKDCYELFKFIYLDVINELYGTL